MNIHDTWGGVGSLLRRLDTAAIHDTGPWELTALVAIVAALWVAHRQLLRWRPTFPAKDGPASWIHALLARIAIPCLAGILSLVAFAALQFAGRPASLLPVLCLLAAVLAGVRCVLFAFTCWASPSAALTRTERLAGWVLWALTVLWLLNWLQPALNTIDAIAIPFGGTRVSLLDAVRVVTVLLLFIAGATYVGGFVEKRLLRLTNVPIGIRVGTAKVTRVVLIVLATLIAFNAVGVNLTALTVMGGAVGVGLGFGLQRIASNFVSGFILLGDRSIRPGDVITIGTRFGVVRELRARYVVVRDRDGVDTLIPNENIITSEVINWSYADRHIRLKLPVQISYQDDPRQAMRLMEHAAQEHPRVEADPAPAARVMGFGESGIDLELRFWIDDPEDGVMNVRSDLYLAIWDAFKAAAITIPYPQRDVRFPGAPPSDPKNTDA